MIKVGIYGASGYMGSEALRVLLKHPEVSVEWATSRSDTPVEYYHKNFYGRDIQFIKPDKATPCDAVFFALPTGLTTELSKPFYENGSKIIDFGADFRLNNQEEWESVYNKKHLDWDMSEKAVYGLVELHRDGIKKSNIIANPGCFSSSSILALAPLVKEGLIDLDKIIVDGLSGTVGAGDDLDLALHHPEIHNNILPYNVVNHRHSYEIEQELSLIAGKKVIINFSSCYIPISRGVMTINHAFPKKTVNRKNLLDLYKDFYRDEYFIKVTQQSKVLLKKGTQKKHVHKKNQAESWESIIKSHCFTRIICIIGKSRYFSIMRKIDLRKENAIVASDDVQLDLVLR